MRRQSDAAVGGDRTERRQRGGLIRPSGNPGGGLRGNPGLLPRSAAQQHPSRRCVDPDDIDGADRAGVVDVNRGNTNWFLLQCRGCENIFCHTVKTFSEDYQHEWDEETQQDIIVMDEDVAYWPAVSGRKRPDWFASARDDRANAGHRHQSLAGLILTGQRFDLAR